MYDAPRRAESLFWHMEAMRYESSIFDYTRACQCFRVPEHSLPPGPTGLVMQAQTAKHSSLSCLVSHLHSHPQLHRSHQHISVKFCRISSFRKRAPLLSGEYIDLSKVSQDSDIVILRPLSLTAVPDVFAK